jgi:hypothetical protein
LIGLKQSHRELFEEIDWSTERVFEQTKERADQIGVAICELPRGFDVDDRVTLHRLCGELLGKNARGSVAPRTKEFLGDLIARERRTRIWSM